MERSRILVVDDDPLIRGSLYEMLQGRGHEVEMASDGAEAISQLKRRGFQLYLPVFLPGECEVEDGVKPLKRQRAVALNKSVHSVVLCVAAFLTPRL